MGRFVSSAANTMTLSATQTEVNQRAGQHAAILIPTSDGNTHTQKLHTEPSWNHGDKTYTLLQG